MAFQLIWHGHSTVQVMTSSINIVIDPFFDGNPACSTKWSDVVTNIVLVTHGGACHGDHEGQAVEIATKNHAKVGAIVELASSFVERGLDRELLLNGSGWNIGGTVNWQGTYMTMVQAFHSSGHGLPVGYIIQLPGGYTIYHAGDTGIFGDMALYAKRYSIDLALLPAGGVFTMDMEDAARAAALLGAKSAMPIHWGTFPALAQSAEPFVEALHRHAPACKPLCIQPGQRVSL